MYSTKRKNNNETVSKHYQNQRYKREKFIEEYLHGDGNIVDGFIVDKGHSNGAEIHSLTDEGIIIVHNYNTGALVTKLIAREDQIKRYYKVAGRTPPQDYKHILELARWHEGLCYNYM